MTEVLIAIKTLFLSALLVTLMQIRISGITIEGYALTWLQSSSVAHFVQGAATGGILAGKDLYRSVSQMIQGSPYQKESKAQR